jgi:hypothetical protein
MRTMTSRLEDCQQVQSFNVVKEHQRTCKRWDYITGTCCHLGSALVNNAKAVNCTCQYDEDVCPDCYWQICRCCDEELGK